MKESDNVISVQNLDKNFGSFKALDGLNLEVKKGEVHGFLGPNGSGKSTTIRVLLGLLKKSGGTTEVYGKDPWSNANQLHKRLSYVPGDVNLWPGLSGGEIIDLFTDLRGKINKSLRDELIQRFNLDPTKKFRTYSKGNRQKVALISALASDVDLYILDEPTSGLDPLMESVFQEYVNKLKSDGKTILLSSHILAEVEALCDRVTIIRDGKTIESDTLNNIQKIKRTNFEITSKKSTKDLAKLNGVLNYELGKNGTATFEVEPESLNSIMKKLATFDLLNVTSHPPSLEELFLRHYDDNDKSKEA